VLWRFSLYGFLKNQRYFEAFLYLFFIERGLSFALIGTLIAFREICINVMEVPSGALADLYGRRRCMMLSFSAYIGSFVLFGLAHALWMFFAAMLLFAVGEAFRTGTHKAMIFDWLASEGRAKEKTKFYGYTRSWSQYGSALSYLLGPAIVVVTAQYASTFWFCIVPYVMGLANFAAYPPLLDGQRQTRVSLRLLFRHLLEALRQCVGVVALRRLLVESMTHDGMYKTIKDYVQPLLMAAVLAVPVLADVVDARRVAFMVPVVYVPMALLGALGARRAHRFSEACGGEWAASRRIWLIELVVFAVLIPAFFYGVYPVAILAFIALGFFQNVWRPIFLSRVDDSSDAQLGATILSIESQVRSGFVIVAAPLIGLAVDHFGTVWPDGTAKFWPIGAVGVLTAAFVLLTVNRHAPQVVRQAEGAAGGAGDGSVE